MPFSECLLHCQLVCPSSFEGPISSKSPLLIQIHKMCKTCIFEHLCACIKIYTYIQLYIYKCIQVCQYLYGTYQNLSKVTFQDILLLCTAGKFQMHECMNVPSLYPFHLSFAYFNCCTNC